MPHPFAHFANGWETTNPKPETCSTGAERSEVEGPAVSSPCETVGSPESRIPAGPFRSSSTYAFAANCPLTYSQLITWKNAFT